MARAQCHTDLTVGLEATDAGAMAGTRINNDVGPLRLGDGNAFGWNDAEQLIVAGRRDIRPVDHHLAVVDKDRRASRRLVFKKDVAALAQHISRQQHPLATIAEVGHPVVQEVTPCALGIRHLPRTFRKALECCLGALGMGTGDARGMLRDGSHHEFAGGIQILVFRGELFQPFAGRAGDLAECGAGEVLSLLVARKRVSHVDILQPTML